MIATENLVKITDLDLADRIVLIRSDLNVPLENGKVTSDQRIIASMETIRMAISSGAGVILLSHLGRPQAGLLDERFSLAPIADRLSKLLSRDIRFERNWLDGIEISAGEVVLCENVRFNIGELENNINLSKKMATLADIFVMDAFGTAHRAHASTEGMFRYAPVVCAGPLLVKELDALHRSFQAPARPLIAIVGGSKVSTKLMALDFLTGIVDHLIIGGGIANTFIAASGYSIGKSMHEGDLIPEARRLLKDAKKNNKNIPLPIDVVVAKSCTAEASTMVKSLETVEDDELILDIGPRTVASYSELILEAGTIVWNGPIGVFEIPAFSVGTQALASAVGSSRAFSIVGGGDTLAAVEMFDLAQKMSYLSTGGGAFLEFMEGRNLPAVTVLEDRAID
tara:strand:+ start:140 stop:1330 length:1191 start_codon:yes stop_codon:yes gene_type:complete